MTRKSVSLGLKLGDKTLVGYWPLLEERKSSLTDERIVFRLGGVNDGQGFLYLCILAVNGVGVNVDGRDSILVHPTILVNTLESISSGSRAHIGVGEEVNGDGPATSRSVFPLNLHSQASFESSDMEQ